MNQADFVRLVLENELGASNVQVMMQSNSDGFSGCQVIANVSLAKILEIAKQKNMDIVAKGGKITLVPTETTAQCYSEGLAARVINEFDLTEGGAKPVDTLQLERLIDKFANEMNYDSVMKVRMITGCTADKAAEVVRYIAVNFAGLEPAEACEICGAELPVNIGDTVEDYNGTKLKVVKVSRVYEEVRSYDSTGAAADEYEQMKKDGVDPTTELWVAVQGKPATYVYLYGEGGVKKVEPAEPAAEGSDVSALGQQPDTTESQTIKPLLNKLEGILSKLNINSRLWDVVGIKGKDTLLIKAYGEPEYKNLAAKLHDVLPAEYNGFGLALGATEITAGFESHLKAALKELNYEPEEWTLKNSGTPDMILSIDGASEEEYTELTEQLKPDFNAKATKSGLKFETVVQ